MGSLQDFEGCQIIERLRSGPVADLYHAIQQPLGRPVLIKALSSSILPSSPFAATLEREARVLAELHHPNILHLYDFIRRDERMWLVLEYVDGWTLDELLERTKILAAAAACSIAVEVARALDHAHEHGIVHRDVQPKNILVSRKGRVKLFSFSVAVDERLPTAPELLDGSTPFSGPAYMSPEQILGESPDPRSDLFSLGVVLYEMLCGRRPFDAPDERNVTQHIRHDPPAPLPRDGVDIPNTLERIVSRCLEKMQSDRFHSASELALALESVIVELGGGAGRQIIGNALIRSGLVAEASGSMADAVPTLSSARQKPSLAGAARGLVVCFVLIVLGGGVIQYFAARNEDSSTARHSSSELSLVPRRPGYLRVVADPWAHVIVDGQKVDTTPFAHPIPLSAGTHYIRLEHPNAASERRTIRLVPGETVLLDVKLKVEALRAAEPDDAELGSPPEDGAAESSPSP